MSATTRLSLNQLWLVETLRLQEAHWGPLDDADAVRHARLGPPALEARIVERAGRLARASGLDRRIAQWRKGALWAGVALALFAIVAGVLAAAGALGRGDTPVNIVWALVALIGVHAFTFLLWLTSLLWRSSATAGLGALWLWLTRKLARAPDQALVLPALVNVVAQAGARGALLGLIAHAWWTLAFVAVLLTLVAMLSTAQYQFVWATTLLAPERFVALSNALGALPAWLGFHGPSPEMVRQSDGTITLPLAVQAEWSLWLIGVVIIYGLLPRLAALALCAARLVHALRRARLDLSSPGLDALAPRLLPDVAVLGDDGVAPAIHQPRMGAALRPAPGHTHHAGLPLAAALEWPADAPWPPAMLETALADTPAVQVIRVDTRDQRRDVLDALAAHPAPRLLLVCDVHMTPDRGVIGAVAEFSRHALHTRVCLVPSMADDSRPARANMWRERLEQAGLHPDDIITGPAAAASVNWLVEPGTQAEGRP